MLESEVTFNSHPIPNLYRDTFTFGGYLRAVRTAKASGKLSIRELAKRVNKTPTYISDIEKGNNKPPNEDLLSDIIIALELGENTDSIKNNLFDLAARERGCVPSDIAKFIIENPEITTAIRLAKADDKKKQQLLQILE